MTKKVPRREATVCRQCSLEPEKGGEAEEVEEYFVMRNRGRNGMEFLRLSEIESSVRSIRNL